LLTSQVTEAAEAQLRENPDLLTQPAIILSHPNWPGGVVGIVANRLVERYHKPAILFAESDDGILRGSARSVEGLHITEAITANKDLLLSFGGHPMAAGMSLQQDNFTSFRRGLGKAVEKQLGETVFDEPTLQIDAWLTLDQITLALANDLEMLAPFGAGNPKLILASRRVKFISATEIGKTREHLRLMVEDDLGKSQPLLWWGGAGESLPELGSTIDVAYSIRPSTFRGEKQVSLTFDEFRISQEKVIEIQPARLEVIDLRLKPISDVIKMLESVPSIQVWAEGVDKDKGASRFDLALADELIIYTSPPSPADLRSVLGLVKPKKVYVFASVPETEKTDSFLSRLSGLCKFALKQYGGETSIKKLSAVLACRESAVRIGLEWLAAGGHVAVASEDDAVLLSKGNGETNQYLQKELFIALRGILEETSAFREYFSKADLNKLME
jgi:single-stranded-DNA-specific exonuclease